MNQRVLVQLAGNEQVREELSSTEIANETRRSYKKEIQSSGQLFERWSCTRKGKGFLMFSLKWC